MTRNELLERAKPILFNTEMVRAIQDGTKTVTRRVIKPKFTNTKIVIRNEKAFETVGTLATTTEIKSPYQVGDILYVRETWLYEGYMHDLTAGKPDLPSGRYSFRYIYKADSPDYPVDVGADGWEPSIHMPKEAARIFLRVTDVRVERLQDCGNMQAKDEGCNCCSQFARIWDSTIKKSDLEKYGWNANPWVWVVEFERVEVSDEQL